jgi:glycosyltransferase involved in cell wall biosynthesis
MNDRSPIYLLTSVRNEGGLVRLLLNELREVFAKAGMLPRVRLVIVDDHSTDDTVAAIRACASSLPDLPVEVIELRSNRGNQSAMAHGLRLLAPRLQDGMLLTFDADGEDDLTRLPELVEMLDRDPTRMVFVYRESRKDGFLIRTFYAFYRIIYRLLTGQELLPCNLMAVPASMIPSICASPLLPLHFSYPPLRLRLPFRAIGMARRARYSGRSSQNLSMLIQHALIGLTIFYEQVVARVMLLTGAVVAVTTLLALVILAARIFVPHMVPIGFPTLVFVFLLGFGFVSIVLLVVFCLASSIFRLLIEQGRPE